MTTPLRVAVIGAGAFGRNHLRVLNDLTRSAPAPWSSSEPPGADAFNSISDRLSRPSPSDERVSVQLTALVEPNPSVRAEAAARYNIPAFASVDHLLSADLDLHAATIAIPTVAHATVARQLLEAGLDILVEKPLTATLAEADNLLMLAGRLGRIITAGHLERFNPAVTAALRCLTRPMFFEAHRLSVFTPRSLDVDVVLDLMIHDLDILLTMAASPVVEVRAVGLPVLSRKVDIANVRLEFASGAIANLTASRVSTEQVRKLRLFQPAQYLSLDYARQELLTINVDPTVAAAVGGTSSRSKHHPSNGEIPTQAAPLPTALNEGTHPSAGLSFKKLDLPRTEPLHLELEDFLHAVATRTQPRVTAGAARNALALALDINTAIEDHALGTGLA